MQTAATPLLFMIIFFVGLSATRAEKGLLPEIRIPANTHHSDDVTFKSEVLITKAENQAILGLQKLIKNRKNEPDEPDLHYRLAELYMRRAKSGRFFDMEKKYNSTLHQLGLPNQSEKNYLQLALNTYKFILQRYPDFTENDFVLFNSALAYQKLNQSANARNSYALVVENFSASKLVPDAHVEIAEIDYNNGKFADALKHLQAAQKFKENRVYPYAVYKSAWCYYNMRQTELGIEKLLHVAEIGKFSEIHKNSYNLRKEALQDLVLFASEQRAADSLLAFFKSVAEPDEIDGLVLKLSDLYASHSRHKDLIILVDGFLSQFPQSAAAPALSVSLIKTYENSNQRPMVIKSLLSLSALCNQKAPEEKKLCNTHFEEISTEISQRWWTVWLKNKNHAEFSDLTAQVFEIQLAHRPTDISNWNTRYAYSELLFAQKKYSQAAINYQTVSEIKELDIQKKHDSLYSAIYCHEQHNASEKISVSEEQKKLMERYHSEFRNQEHWPQITAKLAQESYRTAHYEQALRLSQLLVSEKSQTELRDKSEDMILDIFNLKKDYRTLKKKIEIFAATAGSSARKKYLQQLLVQTSAAETYDSIEDLSDLEKIKKLEIFYDLFPETEEAKKALLKALDTALHNSLLVKAGDLGLKIASTETNPKIQLLQDAAQAYTQAGHLTKAVLIYKKYPDLQKANPVVLCELLELENRKIESAKCYLNEFLSTDKKESLENLAGILQDMIEKETSRFSKNEISAFTQRVLELKIEPYSTNFLFRQAQLLFDAGQEDKAFALTLKINSRPVEARYRAPARILQARILQKEFEAQSIRTNQTRLALVLAIKTEKMDKALTAFSSALKMSENKNEQLLCLQAIDRLYQHFLYSLESIAKQATISAEQRNALSAELAPIIQFLNEKRQVNSAQIFSMTEDLTFEGPLTQALAHFKDYWHAPGEKPVKETSQTEALQLIEMPKTRARGLYYLSLIAHQNKQYRRAVWFAEKSIGLNPGYSLAYYQKSRSSFFLENTESILTKFKAVIESDLQIKEAHLLRAVHFYVKKDFSNSQIEISKLSQSDWVIYRIEPLISKILGNVKDRLSLSKGDSI